MNYTKFTSDEIQAIEERQTALRFLFFPFQVLAMVSIAFPWPVDHWAIRVFWILVTSYFMLCWTSCFHETAHQTLFRSQNWSIAIGRALGALMFVPYTAYREVHIRHHAYLNKPNDWELWPYSDPSTSIGFRRLFVWGDLFAGILFGPLVYGRIYFHKDSPLTDQQRRAVRWEVVLIVAFWASVLTVVTRTNTWGFFLIVWVAPHCLAGIYQNGRKLTEHLGMQSYDPLLGTRTVVGSSLFTRLSTFLNFDIFVHGPHHRHPRVSHDQLADLTRQYVEDSDEDYPIYHTYAGATRDMLPWLFRNPGVGMNVGAPPPTESNQVDNFVADVTTEVLAN